METLAKINRGVTRSWLPTAKTVRQKRRKEWISGWPRRTSW
jgi:hypothetical protein